MPRLIRLYIVSVAIGFALSALLVALLLAFDVAGLRRLVLGSDVGLVAVAMLVVFNGVVLSGVQFGFAVMQMGREGGSGGRGGRLFTKDVAQPLAVPVRVKSAGRLRRF